MQYYTFNFDEESQELCIITKPFGMDKYIHIPMGLKYTPDFAQQIIEQVV